MWSRSPGKDKDGVTRWVASDERDVQGSEKGQSKGNPAHPILVIPGLQLQVSFRTKSLGRSIPMALGSWTPRKAL